MTTPTFLPWLRRGLARSAGPVDPLRGPLPAAAELHVDVELVDSIGNTTTTGHTRPLLGPGQVTGIDAAQIIRFEPAPGSIGVETNYFPFVELLAPDLPWLLTPASPGPDGGLRPWLVLIVVEEGTGVTFDSAGAGSAGTITVDADQIGQQLWDLADSYAWTHVQSSVSDTAIAAAVEAGSGTVIARMLCPRKLRRSRSYRAAVVPAFEAGRAAGLGLPLPAGDLTPAWTLDQTEPAELPVFATWTFATSAEAGDFESLAQRLQPDSGGGRIGVHPCRLDTGGLLPAPDPALDLRFEYAGALTDPDLAPHTLPVPTRKWLEPALETAIDRGAARTTVPPEPRADYRPQRDDPVLAPPMYGRWPAHRRQLPEGGWLRTVNVDMGDRVAAGLGAEIVQRNQEAFLASAWDQTGALRQATVEASRSRLTAEVGDRHHARLSRLDDSALLFAVGTTKTFIPQGGGSVQSALATSAVLPAGLLSAAFFRASRGGSVLARCTGAAGDKPLATRIADSFLAASAPSVPPELRQVATFTASHVPNGAIVRPATAPIRARTRTAAPDLPFPLPGGAGRASASAEAVRSTLPSASVGAGFAARAKGIGLDGGSRILTRIVVGPWFPDGLVGRLIEISPELLVPGISDVSMDRVRLLAINESFVASLLVGANHQWAREALWREFPADLAATVFASLFDRPGDPTAPGPKTDLNTELHNAVLGARLESMVGGAETSTVLLIRAELVRRFPGLIVTLLKPDRGELPIDNDEIEPAFNLAPMFAGTIDAATLFAGFDVDPGTVVAEGWWVNLEQPVTGPRFGFDAAVATGDEPDQPPEHWSDLTWGHLFAADPALTHVHFDRLGWLGQTRDGLTWGRNSAHQAAIAYQRPFRMIFPAAALIGTAP